MNSRQQASVITRAMLVPVLLGLYLVLTSGFELLPALGVFDAKRFLELVLFLLLTVVFLVTPALRAYAASYWRLMPAWTRWLLVAAFTLAVISAIRFPHPSYGLADVGMLALLVLIILIVAASRRLAGVRFDRLALVSIALLGGIVAAVEIVGYVAGWNLGVEFRYEEMLIRFAHPRFYNQVQTWTLPLLAALPFVLGMTRKAMVLTVLLLGLQWFIVFSTGARGTFIALLTAIFLVTILVRARRAHWLGLHFTGFVAGVIFYATTLWAHGLLVPGGDGSFVAQSVGRPMLHTTGRTTMWRAAWSDTLENPLLGVGPGRFICEKPESFAAHPHNWPLTLATEWGIPATLMILLVLAWLGWALLKDLARNRNSGIESGIPPGALAVSLIAAALHANVSGMLIMPASQVAAVFVCGWLIGALNPDRMKGKLIHGTMIGLAALLISASLLTFSARELNQMNLRIPPDLRLRMAPRYWLYGNVCRYSWEEVSTP